MYRYMLPFFEGKAITQKFRGSAVAARGAREVRLQNGSRSTEKEYLCPLHLVRPKLATGDHPGRRSLPMIEDSRSRAASLLAVAQGGTCGALRQIF
jgi:hypothetical protein